jgi:hypothetical protein
LPTKTLTKHFYLGSISRVTCDYSDYRTKLNSHFPCISGLAAAILDFLVVVELPNVGHFIAPIYLRKVTEEFPLTPSGLKMAFKRVVWEGTFINLKKTSRDPPSVPVWEHTHISCEVSEEKKEKKNFLSSMHQHQQHILLASNYPYYFYVWADYG